MPYTQNSEIIIIMPKLSIRSTNKGALVQIWTDQKRQRVTLKWDLRVSAQVLNYSPNNDSKVQA